jgi:hypothetical protein
MKRAIFEWGAIFGVTLSLLLFGYWLFSLRSRAADFELTWWLGESGLKAAASDGTLMLSNPGTAWETIEVIEVGMFITPAPTARSYLALPGLRTGYMKFADGSIDWYLHISLLAPLTLVVLLTLLCAWQFWRIRGAALAKATKTIHDTDKAAGIRSSAITRRAGCMMETRR